MNMKQIDCTTRRAFIGTSLLALGGCALPFGSVRPKTALQLYSIHKIFWSEPEKILAELAAAGYDGVEFYDFNGKSARELRSMCAAAGIQPMGTHLDGNTMLVGDELKRTLDYAAEVGFTSIVTPHALRNSAEEYRAFGRAMGVAAEAAAPYGITVGIHTTYAHFTTHFGEDTAWDMIYRDASPLLMQQIDTGNTFHTGADVVAIIKKYTNRHHSIHLKENVPTREGVFGEPPTDGGKCVPWKDVFAQLRQESSLRWMVVEAEGNPASLEPAKKCRDFLARCV